MHVINCLKSQGNFVILGNSWESVSRTIAEILHAPDAAIAYFSRRGVDHQANLFMCKIS